jgi:hypothetical protein
MPPLVAQYPDAHCVHYYIHYFGRSYTYDAVKTWSIFVINCMYCLLLMATFLHLGCGQIHVGPSCYLMSKDLGSDCTNKPSKTPPHSHIPTSVFPVARPHQGMLLRPGVFSLYTVLPTADGLCLQVSPRLSLLIHISKGFDAASIYMPHLWPGASWANCTSEHNLSLDRGTSEQAG